MSMTCCTQCRGSLLHGEPMRDDCLDELCVCHDEYKCPDCCATPCSIDMCTDCGNEFDEPCKLHENCEHY